LETKSLLPSLYKGEVEATLRGDSLRELPLFGNHFPVIDRQRGARGDFEKNMTTLIIDLLVIHSMTNN
jgi:hypothetical protein